MEKGFEFCFLKFHLWCVLLIMSGPVVGQSIMVAVCGRAPINLMKIKKQRDEKGKREKVHSLDHLQ